MKSLDAVRRQLAVGRFDLTRHALRRIVERDIKDLEIQEAGEAAELIEDYPDDKYSPSALLLGFTAAGRPLHFQVSLSESSTSRIITIYEPDADEWIDFRRRR